MISHAMQGFSKISSIDSEINSPPLSFLKYLTLPNGDESAKNFSKACLALTKFSKEAVSKQLGQIKYYFVYNKVAYTYKAIRITDINTSIIPFQSNLLSFVTH